MLPENYNSPSANVLTSTDKDSILARVNENDASQEIVKLYVEPSSRFSILVLLCLVGLPAYVFIPIEGKSSFFHLILHTEMFECIPATLGTLSDTSLEEIAKPITV